jgi:prepilin-type processing-associated H-X9-DG protein
MSQENQGDTLAYASASPNLPYRLGPSAGSVHTRTASSLHPGGVNVLMGDGAVRFVADTIDSWPTDPVTGEPSGALWRDDGWWENLPKPRLWQTMASRAGGEIMP